MLGRKQSLRGELLPYELAQEEINNESVGVDWINKVIFFLKEQTVTDLKLYFNYCSYG